MILENKNQIYIDILPYTDIKNELREEKLRQNDIILDGDSYNNVVETRKSLLNNLKSTSSKIRKLDIVGDVNPNPSRYKDGLSVYINILFKHPQDITTEERDKYYKYIIRLSDHKDKHPKECVTSRITTTGRKVSDLNTLVMQAFNDSLPKIEDRIREFELEKYGEQKTFLTKTNESLKLRIRESISMVEQLEEITPNTYCSDYVGDIVNWIINKPKPYRILYDSKFDVWCIADAISKTHWQMAEDLFDSNYLLNVTNSLNDWIQFARNDDDYDSDYTNKEVYAGYGFDHRLIAGLFFIPNGVNPKEYEESGLYNVATKLVSGTIFSRRDTPFNKDGIFKDLYRKLKISGELE